MIFYLSPLFIIMYLLNFKKENMMLKFYIFNFFLPERLVSFCDIPSK